MMFLPLNFASRLCVSVSCFRLCTRVDWFVFDLLQPGGQLVVV